MDNTNPYRASSIATPPPNAEAVNGSLRRLKSITGWIAFGCFIGSTIGTVIAMVSSFSNIAVSGQPGSTVAISGSIDRSLLFGVVLIPIGLVALLGWLVCWWRLRRASTT